MAKHQSVRSQIIAVLKASDAHSARLGPDFEALADALMASGLVVPELIAPQTPKTQEEKIAFRKDWDRRVDEGKKH